MNFAGMNVIEVNEIYAGTKGKALCVFGGNSEMSITSQNLGPNCHVYRQLIETHSVPITVQ